MVVGNLARVATECLKIRKFKELIPEKETVQEPRSNVWDTIKKCR